MLHFSPFAHSLWSKIPDWQIWQLSWFFSREKICLIINPYCCRVWVKRTPYTSNNSLLIALITTKQWTLAKHRKVFIHVNSFEWTIFMYFHLFNFTNYVVFQLLSLIHALTCLSSIIFIIWSNLNYPHF